MKEEVLMATAIRISIANLGWEIACMRTGEIASIAVLSKRQLMVGERMWTALGGGAMLTTRGKEYFEDWFSAENFEVDEETGFYDMRFTAHEEALESIFKALEVPLSTELEIDPTQDIQHELLEERISATSLLSPADLAQARFIYSRTVRQAPLRTADTSRRSGSASTRRLFRIFQIVLPSDLYQQFLTHPHVTVLSEKELRTTLGGSSAGVTKQGDKIANNLFLG